MRTNKHKRVKETRQKEKIELYKKRRKFKRERE